MIYINTKTGSKISTDCKIAGKHWEIEKSKKKKEKGEEAIDGQQVEDDG